MLISTQGHPQSAIYLPEQRQPIGTEVFFCEKYCQGSGSRVRCRSHWLLRRWRPFSRICTQVSIPVALGLGEIASDLLPFRHLTSNRDQNSCPLGHTDPSPY